VGLVGRLRRHLLLKPYMLRFQASLIWWKCQTFLSSSWSIATFCRILAALVAKHSTLISMLKNQELQWLLYTLILMYSNNAHMTKHLCRHFNFWTLRFSLEYLIKILKHSCVRGQFLCHSLSATALKIIALASYQMQRVNADVLVRKKITQLRLLASAKILLLVIHAKSTGLLKIHGEPHGVNVGSCECVEMMTK